MSLERQPSDHHAK